MVDKRLRQLLAIKSTQRSSSAPPPWSRIVFANWTQRGFSKKKKKKKHPPVSCSEGEQRPTLTSLPTPSPTRPAALPRSSHLSSASFDSSARRIDVCSQSPPPSPFAPQQPTLHSQVVTVRVRIPVIWVPLSCRTEATLTSGTQEAKSEAAWGPRSTNAKQVQRKTSWRRKKKKNCTRAKLSSRPESACVCYKSPNLVSKHGRTERRSLVQPKQNETHGCCRSFTSREV